MGTALGEEQENQDAGRDMDRGLWGKHSTSLRVLLLPRATFPSIAGAQGWHFGKPVVWARCPE